ncbi:MAG: hypothetical protein K6E83_06475 [Clostridium sp.]|nr:hypothetical protein [Clostridium sp.]
MSWELAIGFIAGEVAGIVIMAILSGRLDRRMAMKEKKRAADGGASAAAHEAQKGFNL